MGGFTEIEKISLKLEQAIRHAYDKAHNKAAAVAAAALKIFVLRNVKEKHQHVGLTTDPVARQLSIAARVGYKAALEGSDASVASLYSRSRQRRLRIA